MITIFNRRELEITYSIDRQAQIRSLLSSHNINYYLRVVNSASPSVFNNQRFGSFGQKIDISNEYIFYVHKKNYELALAIINGRY